jgi:hypothetical protein
MDGRRGDDMRAPRKGALDLIFASSGGGREAVACASVLRIKLARSPHLGGHWMWLEGQDAQAALRCAGLSCPEETGRHILALPTGRLIIRHVDGEGTKRTRRLTVLGDFALQDEGFPDVTYAASEEFARHLPPRIRE